MNVKYLQLKRRETILKKSGFFLLKDFNNRLFHEKLAL